MKLIRGRNTLGVTKLIGGNADGEKCSTSGRWMRSSIAGWGWRPVLLLAMALSGEARLSGAVANPLTPIGPGTGGVPLPSGKLDAGKLAKAIRGELVFSEAIEHAGVDAPPARESSELLDVLLQLRRVPNPALLEQFIREHPKSGWVPSLRSHLAQSYAQAGRFTMALAHWLAAWEAVKHFEASQRRLALEESILAPWVRLLSRMGQVEELELRLAECRGRPFVDPKQRQAVTAATEVLENVRQHPGESFTCGTVALQRVVRALMPTNLIRCDAFLAYAPPTGFSLQALAELARQNNWPLVAARRTSGWDLAVPSVVHWRQNHFAAILGKRGATYLIEDPVLGGRRWLHRSIVNEEASGNFLVPRDSLSGSWRELTAEEASALHGRWAPNNVDDRQDEGCGRDPECCPAGMPTWWITEPYINQWLADQPVFYVTSGGQRVAFELTFKQREWRSPPVINRFSEDLRSSGWNHGWLSYICFTDPIAGDESRWIGQSQDGPVFGDFGETSFYLGRDILTSAEICPLLWLPGYSIRRLQRSGEYCAIYFAQGEFDEEASYPGYALSGVVIGYPRPTYTNFVADLYAAEGGLRHFHNTNIWGLFHARSKSQLEPLQGLVPAKNATNGFQLSLPDGAVEYFELVARSTNSFLPETAIAFRTRSVDAAGRTTRFVFETNAPPNRAPLVRLKYVVDSDGRTNTLDYDQQYPNLVTRVQDPHGRTARMAYDPANGLLTQIVDAAGITNSLRYCFVGSDPAVEELITPYGSTRFAFFEQTDDGPGNLGGENRLNRSVTVTGPDGSSELYCFRYQTVALDSTVPEDAVPESGIVGPLDDGIGSDEVDHVMEKVGAQWRNSFYWSRRQFSKLTTSDPNSLTDEDYARARIRHWLAETNPEPRYLSACLSWERQASLDGTSLGHFVFYGYPGKPLNNAHQVGTDPYPNLVAERLPNNETRFTRYDRNDLGYPVSVTSTYTLADGGVGQRTWGFGYAPSNQIDLLFVTGPDGQTNALVEYDHHQPTRFIAADGAATLLQYDARTRNLTKLILPSGAVCEREYYPHLPLGYANAGFLKEERWLGYRTNAFDYQKGLPRTHLNELGFVTTLSWDDLLRLRRTDFSDGTWSSNCYTWLDLTATVDRLGQRSHFSYDSRRRLVQSTDPAGRTNRWSYCDCGASPESFANALGETTTWQYDDNGRVRAIAAPGLDPANYERDRLGRVISLAQGNRRYKVEYNHQGEPAVVRGPEGEVLRRSYDARDRAVVETDASGVAVARTFDVLNRPLTATRPDGSAERWAYLSGYPEVYRHTDQLGQETTLIPDRLGRIGSVHRPNGEVLSFTYTPDGQVRTLTDGKGQITSWDFDNQGRALRKWIGGQLAWTNAHNANGWLTGHFTPEKQLTQYAHDAVGNVLLIDYPTSADVVLRYDAANRLTNLTDSVGTHEFTWTPWGGLASEDGPWAEDTINYGYDGLRLRRTLTVQQPASTAWSQTYSYDAAGRLSGLTSSAGRFSYDHLNASQQVSRLGHGNGSATISTHDGLGRRLSTVLLASSGTGLDTHGYRYDAANRRTQHELSAGHAWVFGYDATGQLTSAQGSTGTGSPRIGEQLSYGYDLAGNLASRQNGALLQTFLGFTPQNQPSSVTRSGTIAVSGVLAGGATSAGVNGQPAEIYPDSTFAAAGVSLADGPNIFTATATDISGRRATNTVSAWLPRTTILHYDQNGNLTSDGQRSFEYDDANQLTAVQVAGKWRSEFQYDGFGRQRLRREYAWSADAWTQTDAVRYVCDGLLVLQERDAHNQPLATYTRGADISGRLRAAGGIGGLLARTTQDPTIGDARTTTYYHSDAGGNITALTDEQGQIAARYQYDPFGNLLNLSGTHAEANPYRFSSKEFHERSGLYYYGFRFYDPKLQRWLTRDPIEENGGINLYGFVGNQPTGQIDPDGRFLDTLWDLANMGYDFGRVMWGMATENAEMAREGWKDLSLDAAAAMVPFVPAGASKAGRIAARVLDKAPDAKKAAKRACAAADTAAKVKCIGKLDDLQGIPRGQTLLDDLPQLGSPRANYYQNSSVLRKALRDGYEIRDASAHRPNWSPDPTRLRPDRTVGQSFLGAERNILDNKGLTLSPSGAYVPK